MGLSLLHSLNAAAKHCLHRVTRERLLDRRDELYVLHVAAQPTLDASIEIARVLEHECSLGLLIKSDDHISAEGAHSLRKAASCCNRQKVAVERLTREGAGNGTIRADQPQLVVEAQLLRDRK